MPLNHSWDMDVSGILIHDILSKRVDLLFFIRFMLPAMDRSFLAKVHIDVTERYIFSIFFIALVNNGCVHLTHCSVFLHCFISNG